MVLEAWASVTDVETLTGEQVTEADLIRAQDIIELFSGTTYLATENISPTNLRYLNRAVAYQAPWMLEHPDLYTHMDSDSVSQDGASVTPGNENASLLAPLAMRYLRRLTWKTRPWQVRARVGAYGGDDGPRDSAVADDNRIWSPM